MPIRGDASNQPRVLMDRPAPPDPPNGSLGQWSLATLVIASMIGAGVFTTSGFAIADLGDPRWVMVAWAIGGVIAISGAISYGQLARLLTDNGGEYLFLSRFVHPAVGFIAGWVSVLAGFTGAGALAAIAMETYAIGDWERPSWLPPGGIAICLVVVCTVAHAFHTGRGAMRHNVLVAVKLLLIGWFIVWSIGLWPNWHVANSSMPPIPKPSLFTMATSVMWISLSYCGFNAAIYVGREARQGWNDIAGAMVKATVGVTLLYLVLNAIMVFGAAPDEILGKQNVAAVAAKAIGGTSLANLVRVAICLGLASSVSSTIMAGPRVYAKMASDGVLPRWFDSEQSPPTRSVVLQGIAIAIVVSFASLQDLLSYLGLTLSLCSAATVAILLGSGRLGVSINRIGMAAAWFYVIATSVTIGLAAWHRPDNVIATVLTIVSGLIVYSLTLRRETA
ncbi:APC family permease [Rhodopirellula sp. SWK7]|uniref:APC family permease n=1 Tax=Rhodopirellula sp. SWK7 TaxID=595460 RepID=UPI0002BF11CF|nr:APC family permease [Rhodopirellula sp. SWK7]EMI46195.1 Amino acid/polyamine transporter I [Rhodopirellula sp. SWK7]